MTRTLITAALAAATLAAPAVANDQLARSLGVEPGVYSVSELAQLKTAIEENNDQRVDLITGGTGEVLSTQSPAGDFGAGQSDQLARSLGVEPGVYSLSELAQLKTAMEENDHQRIDSSPAGPARCSRPRARPRAGWPGPTARSAPWAWARTRSHARWASTRTTTPGPSSPGCSSTPTTERDAGLPRRARPDPPPPAPARSARAGAFSRHP